MVYLLWSLFFLKAKGDYFMKNVMNTYVADELANKVKILSQTLEETNKIVATLEKENDRLKDILTNLMSINNVDLDSTQEVKDDRFCTI
jgi:ABC-type transporter Mla subunit MlaD